MLLPYPFRQAESFEVSVNILSAAASDNVPVPQLGVIIIFSVNASLEIKSWLKDEIPLLNR